VFKPEVEPEDDFYKQCGPVIEELEEIDDEEKEQDMPDPEWDEEGEEEEQEWGDDEEDEDSQNGEYESDGDPFQYEGQDDLDPRWANPTDEIVDGHRRAYFAKMQTARNTAHAERWGEVER